MPKMLRKIKERINLKKESIFIVNLFNIITKKYHVSFFRVTKGRSESDCELRLTDEPQNYDTLPDRHKSLQMPLAPLPVTKKLTSTAKKAHLMMSDEVHDYSEIYTPSTEVKGVIAEDSGGPTTTASTTSMSSHSEC